MYLSENIEDDLSIKLVNNFRERKLIRILKPNNLITGEKYDMIVQRGEDNSPIRFDNLEKSKIEGTLKIMKYCQNLEVYVSLNSGGLI